MKKTLTGLLLAACSMTLVAPTAGATAHAAQEQYRSTDVHPMIWEYYSRYDTYPNCEDAGYYLERVGIARAHYCEFDKSNPHYPWKLYIDYI